MKNPSRDASSRDVEEVFSKLREQRGQAPDDFVDQVMAALPDHPRPAWRDRVDQLWPDRAQWVAPCLAGAAAALLVVAAAGLGSRRSVDQDMITVTFVLHAPDAGDVELIGSFNNWTTGEILLQGPDATGHWTAEVGLPEGRHEYVFLVDDREWVADPSAILNRPDGFGRMNSILEL